MVACQYITLNLIRTDPIFQDSADSLCSSPLTLLYYNYIIMIYLNVVWFEGEIKTLLTQRLGITLRLNKL